METASQKRKIEIENSGKIFETEIEYFVSDANCVNNPGYTDVFCRFEHPINGRSYQATCRHSVTILEDKEKIFYEASLMARQICSK